MAFDWKQCTVISNNRRNRINSCWVILKRFESKVTPKVYDGLCAYLRYMHRRGDVNKVTPKLLENNIEELLCKCCNKTNIALLMKSDVAYAEDDIVENIKRAIVTSSYKQIYNDGSIVETYEEYMKRKNLTSKDVDNFLREVVEW